MAVLTNNAKASSEQYMIDAKKNRQETPGTANTAGGTGTVGPYDSGSITRIPKPGEGFPTGKSATHTTGNYGKLTDGTMQQATDTTVSTTTSGGLAVSADSHSHPGVNDLQNSLLNDVSSMAGAARANQTSTPTVTTAAKQSSGLSQSPEHE